VNLNGVDKVGSDANDGDDVNLMNRLLRSAYLNSCRILLKPWLTREHGEEAESMSERPVEYRFALKHITQMCPRTVLDVGPGLSSWPHLLKLSGIRVDAIDKSEGYWAEGVFNRHYLVEREDITETPQNSKMYDMVTCISTLEHIPNYKDALIGMFGRLKENGHIVLTTPYNEKKYVRNIYETSGAGYGRDYPRLCQVFNRRSLEAPVEKLGGEVVDQEYYRLFSGEFFTYGQRICPPERSHSTSAHLACLLIRRK
jgi:hypothetical protein